MHNSTYCDQNFPLSVFNTLHSSKLKKNLYIENLHTYGSTPELYISQEIPPKQYWSRDGN